MDSALKKKRLEPENAGARARALVALAQASKEFPQLRLCQIISNAVNSPTKDVFYTDDETLASELVRYVNKEKEEQRLYEEWQEATRVAEEKRRTLIGTTTKSASSADQ